MTCPAGATGSGNPAISCATAQGAGSTGRNNDFSMRYVDVDSDSSTFDSSSATITIPAGATVLYAGLSWSGETTAGTGGAVPVNATSKGAP